jgi:hypothetical protein
LSAIPIAIAILWYGFGRDIGNAGPIVARYVPWLVPDALQGRSRRRIQRPELRDAVVADTREFGPVGVQGESPKTQAAAAASSFHKGPLVPREIPEEGPPNHPDVRDQLAERILALHDQWEADPSLPWPEVQDMIYRNACELAQALETNSNPEEAVRDDLPESLRRLMKQPWFLESIADVASGKTRGRHPPNVDDFLAWTVDELRWVPNQDTGGLLHVSPPLTIDSWAVQWVLSDTLVDQVSQNRQAASDFGRQVVFGQVERYDELGYVVRVIAILP